MIVRTIRPELSIRFMSFILGLGSIRLQDERGRPHPTCAIGRSGTLMMFVPENPVANVHHISILINNLFPALLPKGQVNQRKGGQPRAVSIY